MKKILLFLSLAIFSLSAWADEGDDGDGFKVTKSEEYAMEKPDIRSYGVGRAWRQSDANALAELDARRSMSEKISAAIETLLEDGSITDEAYVGGDDDSKSASETNTRIVRIAKSISKNVVNNMGVVKKDKFFNKKNKKYTIYVCLEYLGTVSELSNRVSKQLDRRIPEEDKLKLRFELDNFDKKLRNALSKGAGEDDWDDLDDSDNLGDSGE